MVGMGQDWPLERELAQIALKRKLQQELEKTKKANEEMLGQKKVFAKEKEELERARKEVEELKQNLAADAAKQPARVLGCVCVCCFVVVIWNYTLRLLLQLLHLNAQIVEQFEGHMWLTLPR